MKIALPVLCLLVAVGLGVAGEPPPAAQDLKENGAFGFPQKLATVLWDQSDLRFSDDVIAKALVP